MSDPSGEGAPELTPLDPRPRADVPGPWRPGPPLPADLEDRIRRDLGRARRIVRLLWVAALASLVLGLVSIRQAVLLVSIDRDIVTTEEVQGLGAGWDPARFVLLIALIGAGLLAVPWLRGVVPVFAALHERGVVDGRLPRPGMARLGLLWRDSGVPAERAGWADLRVAAGRRAPWVALAAITLAAAIGAAAAIGVGLSATADDSRFFRVLAGVAGGLWVAALVLVGAAIDAIAWREAAAARALGLFIPLVDAPGRTAVRLVPVALLFVAGVLVVSGRPDPWFVPCPQATLACDGLLVPADHDQPSTATIWISYAIHRAAGAPLGTLAVAVGGPGASGLAGAVQTVANMDPELVRRYDILFWDQRGVGASEGRDCPEAGLSYALAAPVPRSAQTFAESCLREAGVDPAVVARYATRQAAEDLESIRDHLGIERFALYGESYGTELAQAYALRHPDRLTALVLDGAVDLTLSSIAFWASAAHGFDRSLELTFRACETEPACRADVSDPAAEYDLVLRRFAEPQEVSYGDPDGVVRAHRVSAAAIEAAVGTLLYEPAGRMLIQRAVAAAAHGDAVPLARLVDALGTGSGVGISTFAYHAVLCADYRVSPTADPHDVAAVEDAARLARVTVLRMGEVFASQYPCLFWPYQPADAARPAPLTVTPFPVFVLAATADPITPVGQAEAIAGRLADGYLVVTEGGPHVTFGRGVECVDGPVVAFLLDGRRPASRSISCDGVVAADYIPLTPRYVSGFRDALAVMEAAENELFANPHYLFWTGGDDLFIGCRHGGFMAITPATVQDNLRFADCALVSGVPLTGVGSYSFESGDVRWTVTVPDGELDYLATSVGRRVTGTWLGEAIDISR